MEYALDGSVEHRIGPVRTHTESTTFLQTASFEWGGYLYTLGQPYEDVGAQATYLKHKYTFISVPSHKC
jgi:hypothetical protein